MKGHANRRPRKIKPRCIMILVILIFIFVSVAALACLPHFIINNMVNLHVNFNRYWTADVFGIAANELVLITEDNLKIAAWEVEAENPKAVIICLSGIHNPSVTAFFGHSVMFQNNGYASVLVEMRAHGASEGNVISLGMTEYKDAQAAAAWIRSQEKYNGIPVAVMGLSMGASTAINTIGQTPKIDALISLSAFSGFADVFCDNMKLLSLPKFIAVLEKPFVSLYLGIKYGFDKLKINPADSLEKLNGRPALIMHSTEDTSVPFASFQRIVNKLDSASHIHTFVRKGDYHFICNEYFLEPWEDGEYSSALLGFLSKYFH